MTSFSKAGTGIVLVTMLEFIFPMLGIEVPEGSIAAFVNALGVTFGFFMMIWGQIDRTDLKWGILRK